MYRALAATRRPLFRTGSSTSGRVVAVHNGHEGRVQLVMASELRALDPKCTPHKTSTGKNCGADTNRGEKGSARPK